MCTRAPLSTHILRERGSRASHLRTPAALVDKRQAGESGGRTRPTIHKWEGRGGLFGRVHCAEEEAPPFAMTCTIWGLGWLRWSSTDCLALFRSASVTWSAGSMRWRNVETERENRAGVYVGAVGPPPSKPESMRGQPLYTASPPPSTQPTTGLPPLSLSFSLSLSHTHTSTPAACC